MGDDLAATPFDDKWVPIRGERFRLINVKFDGEGNRIFADNADEFLIAEFHLIMKKTFSTNCAFRTELRNDKASLIEHHKMSVNSLDRN